MSSREPRPAAAPAGIYAPDADRYDGRMPYRRTGRSGLQLPAISPAVSLGTTVSPKAGCRIRQRSLRR